MRDTITLHSSQILTEIIHWLSLNSCLSYLWSKHFFHVSWLHLKFIQWKNTSCHSKYAWIHHKYWNLIYCFSNYYCSRKSFSMQTFFNPLPRLSSCAYCRVIVNQSVKNRKSLTKLTKNWPVYRIFFFFFVCNSVNIDCVNNLVQVWNDYKHNSIAVAMLLCYKHYFMLLQTLFYFLLFLKICYRKHRE